MYNNERRHMCSEKLEKCNALTLLMKKNDGNKHFFGNFRKHTQINPRQISECLISMLMVHLKYRGVDLTAFSRKNFD